MNRDERALLRTVARLATLPPADRRWVIRRLTMPEKRTLNECWVLWAHDGQLAPAAAGRKAKGGKGPVTGNCPQGAVAAAPWLILAGRGFGKTRAGAEWVSDLARRDGRLRIALVGATIEDALNVMVCGRSGLLAVARTGERPVLNRTQCTVRFPSGAEAWLYSGACPEKLRGPEHHVAWCDEIAKWRQAEAAWDNLQLGLRLPSTSLGTGGEAAGPRALVTTTPKASPLLARLAAAARAAGTLVRGRMADNLNLPAAFVAGMAAAYGGTRKGREELDGELILEAEGALWTRALIEACRVAAAPAQGLRRVVIGVDPPASAEGDACGIVACGLGRDGTGYVLGDHSAGGLSPEGWAARVVAAAEAWGADCVIVEKNQGGDMVKAVLRAADAALPVRDVWARYGKGDRAEPVAMLFEGGRARLAGRFPALEDELCGLIRGGGWAGPGRSPDRADAMVWALTDLLLGRAGDGPRVRGF